MKVREFFNLAESIGLRHVGLLYTDEYNFALVTTPECNGEGKGIPNTKHLYNFSFGDAELTATETWVEMRHFWLALEGDKGTAEREKVFPSTAIPTLVRMCEKYDIPVPQEMVALLEAVFA